MTAPRRLLFAAAGGHGHLQPLLPLAAQAASAGHEVLVTGAAALAPHVTGRQLAYACSGPDLTPVHAPLTVHDVEEERRAVGSYFVSRLGRARAVDLLELCRSWRPDVVVRDELDVGAAVAAEVVGAPHVAVIVIGAGGFLCPDVVRGPLDALVADFGIDIPDTVAMLHRHLTLTPFPSSFRDPSDPLVGNVMTYSVPAAPRTRRDGHGRAAYVTLGTIFNTESGDLLRTAALGAAAAAGVDRVLVATGEHVDPATLEPVPEGVAVRRFLHQDAALADSDVVVCHAGSGTVLGALRHGLPTVSLPLGADQHLNAQRLQQLGAGLSLPADAVTAAAVGRGIEEVLGSSSIRRSARAMRAELQRRPPPAEAVAAVVQLTR